MEGGKPTDAVGEKKFLQAVSTSAAISIDNTTY